MFLFAFVKSVDWSLQSRLPETKGSQTKRFCRALITDPVLISLSFRTVPSSGPFMHSCSPIANQHSHLNYVIDWQLQSTLNSYYNRHLYLFILIIPVSIILSLSIPVSSNDTKRIGKLEKVQILMY